MSMFSPAEASLIDRIPYWGFLQDDVILTKNGQVLFLYEVRTAGVDGRAAVDLDRVNQAWQKLLGTIEGPDRAFVFFMRPDQPLPTHFDEANDIAALAQRKRLAYVASRVRRMQTVLCLVFDPGISTTVQKEGAAWWIENVRQWLLKRVRTEHLTVLIREVVDEAVAACRSRAQTLQALVADHTPLVPLNGNAAGQVLFRLLNQGQGVWEPMNRAMPYGLNWRLAGENVAFERSYMTVGDSVVGLYSLALPPRASAANALGELYSLPYDLSVVLEWRPLERYDAAGRIRSVQKHYNTARWSLWAGLSGTEGTGMALEDASSGAAVAQLHRAHLELESDGIPYGEFALSVSVGAESRAQLDEVGAAVQRVFLHLDGKAVQERYGQPSVWFQRFPGQPPNSLPRPIIVSSGQAASMLPIFGPSAGYSRCSHLDAPPLTWFETPWRSPYGFDLFGGRDVGHTLVLGATGSGKSFTLNFVLTQALQYKPRVVILDLGGSYRWVTKFLGGSYLSMNLEEGGKQPRLSPFSLPPSERTYQFLTTWITQLLKLGQYEPRPDDLVDIRERLRDLYELPYEERTLGHFTRLLPQDMWAPLSQWVGDGPWAPTFDGPPEPFEIARDEWQVIDLAGAQEHPDWCTAALFYLFERLRLAIDDDSQIDRLKLMVVDEAWRYLADPAVLNSLMEAAKTWRKRNAALILATQSVVDITASEQARAMLEMLPTKLFLANPDFPDSAAATLSLTDAQIDTIRSLEPKQEMYLCRSSEQVILRLAVDPESYWLYTSSPVDAKHRGEMVKRYGLEGALVRLAAGFRTVADAEGGVSRKAVVA